MHTFTYTTITEAGIEELRQMGLSKKICADDDDTKNTKLDTGFLFGSTSSMLAQLTKEITRINDEMSRLRNMSLCDPTHAEHFKGGIESLENDMEKVHRRRDEIIIFNESN
jgi:hypothetical protein